MKSSAIYRPATPLEIARADALFRCSLPPATMTKRFARDLHSQTCLSDDHKITDKQADYLAVCCYRYRRQMPNHLVPESPPPGYKTPKMVHDEYRLAQARNLNTSYQTS